MNAAEIKRLLQLEPHPVEGGAFRQIYKSQALIAAPQGERALHTAIYYLLEPGSFSEIHRLLSDEIFHFYLGDPVEMLHLHPDGGSSIHTLGQNLAQGECMQLLVPAGHWQGARLLGGGRFALLGCTVSPGFEYADYESGHCEELSRQWPQQAERIRALTRR